MEKYYFYNFTDKNNNHEVHTADCTFLPATENRTYVGEFVGCYSAIVKARADYPSKSFDGCYFCCRPCHEG